MTNIIVLVTQHFRTELQNGYGGTNAIELITIYLHTILFRKLNLLVEAGWQKYNSERVDYKITL